MASIVRPADDECSSNEARNFAVHIKRGNGIIVSVGRRLINTVILLIK